MGNLKNTIVLVRNDLNTYIINGLIIYKVLLLCTWKQLISKFYYCGISTVRRQIKIPRTSCIRKFNFLLHDVLFLVLLLSTDDIIIVILKA